MDVPIPPLPALPGQAIKSASLRLLHARQTRGVLLAHVLALRRLRSDRAKYGSSMTTGRHRLHALRAMCANPAMPPAVRVCRMSRPMNDPGLDVGVVIRLAGIVLFLSSPFQERAQEGTMSGKFRAVISVLALALMCAGGATAEGPGGSPAVAGLAAIGTAFTYQGQLQSGGAPVNDTCDFQFSLWDAAGSGTPPTGGNQAGALQPAPSIPVSNGLFAVRLDFGSGAFAGEARWLQTAVRCPAGGGAYTTLAPAPGADPRSLCDVQPGFEPAFPEGDQQSGQGLLGQERWRRRRGITAIERQWPGARGLRRRHRGRGVFRYQ